MSKVASLTPNKTYKGRWEEVSSHQHEISPEAQVELNVYDPKSESATAAGLFDGKSLADLILEIGTVKGLPDDLASQPQKHMSGFGEIDRREIAELKC